MEGKPKRQRRRPRRNRFETKDAVRSNLESISAAQKRSRLRRKQLARQGQDGTGENLPIIDDRTKSEQAWENALRSVKRPEDLDDFE